MNWTFKYYSYRLKTILPLLCLMMFHHLFASTAEPADLSGKQFHFISLSKKKNKVTVTWSVSVHLQNVYYEVQRAGVDKVFKTAGLLFPEERTMGKKDFTFTDNIKNSRSCNVIYYRIKQVNANGPAVYSLIKALTVINKQATNLSKTVLIYTPVHDNSYCGEKNNITPGYINYMAGILSNGFVYNQPAFYKTYYSV